MPLEMCEGNWSAAEAAKPSIEIASGWVQHIPGGRTAAQARWPSAKLNLVEAPGKDPRLVLDSAVCQVNANCSLLEAVQLPTVSDVSFSFQPSDPHSVWMGASLDFKAAHKQVKVREQGQGMLLFKFAGKLDGYTCAISEPASQPTGGSVLEPYCCASHTSCSLNSLTKPSPSSPPKKLVVLFVCLKMVWCG